MTRPEQDLQAALTSVEAELAETKRQWTLDLDALINARHEIERQAIRIDTLQDQLERLQ